MARLANCHDDPSELRDEQYDVVFKCVVAALVVYLHACFGEVRQQGDELVVLFGEDGN